MQNLTETLDRTVSENEQKLTDLQAENDQLVDEIKRDLKDQMIENS